ncbi:MAG: deoxyribose-phosphate aldolase [Spirochaetales bacterium]|nr:deoxyribose-phosphate aldolase [Spirochaetales bacterium]
MIDHIERYLDAAVLKPDCTRTEAEEAIRDCIAWKTKTVCVRPCDIDLAVRLCRGTETGVSCVLAFPHGDTTSAVKAAEASDYIARGVDEIDMVANIGFVCSGMWKEVTADINAVVDPAKKADTPVKVILETCYLTDHEIRKAVECAVEAGADYVKTSTGFGSEGATKEAVAAMVEAAGGRIKVKASGGIRDRAAAELFIHLGADRLGNGYTSNKAIIQGAGSPGTAEAY